MTAKQAKEKEILSRRELAKLLDLSTRTVARMTREKKLKSYKLDNRHFYKFSDLAKTLESEDETAQAA